LIHFVASLNPYDIRVNTYHSFSPLFCETCAVLSFAGSASNIKRQIFLYPRQPLAVFEAGLDLGEFAADPDGRFFARRAVWLPFERFTECQDSGPPHQNASWGKLEAIGIRVEGQTTENPGRRDSSSPHWFASKLKG
jgi:hypothetical protein